MEFININLVCSSYTYYINLPNHQNRFWNYMAKHQCVCVRNQSAESIKVDFWNHMENYQYIHIHYINLPKASKEILGFIWQINNTHTRIHIIHHSARSTTVDSWNYVAKHQHAHTYYINLPKASKYILRIM